MRWCYIVVILSLVVMATWAVKEELHQKHFKDGEHNIHFDHEAILGSRELEQEFDELPPEEAKRRLKILASKMDKNGDGFVDMKELTAWIMMSYRKLDEEDAMEEFEEKDADKDGHVGWWEYVKTQYNYNENDIKDLRKDERPDVSNFIAEVYDEDDRKFELADANKDGYLDKQEFYAFYLPQYYERMHDYELRRTIKEKDKNTDGLISFEEYLGEGEHDKEWELVEQERFQEYDLNKDHQLNYDEVKPWAIPDSEEEARDEADHLIEETDDNGDKKLSIDEIVDHHDAFVGSQATDYGDYLHIMKDEL